MKYQHRTIGSHLYLVDEIGSTNTELLEKADNYEHGAVLCARKQTAGRGRHKRDWTSQNGGLYFSVLLKEQKDIISTYPFVLLSALAVVRCIHACSSYGVAIKWPNDIYINHRKVCGILAESSTRGNMSNIVVGVGLNVNNKVSHLTGLRNPAVSLLECSGEKVDIDYLMERIINELDLLYADFVEHKFSDHLPELNRLLYAKGQEIELALGDKLRTITPLAFTPDAKLLCEEKGSTREIFLGEM